MGVACVATFMVMSPAVAPMRVVGVWTVSTIPVSMLHGADISLDISNVKIYRNPATREWDC
jgi:hypothetical protein